MTSLDPTAAPPAPEHRDEPSAWAEVLARWTEPAAHRAYLAAYPDLDGLAQAGRRYRAVLAERPDDAVAAAMRDEIVKRATVVGLTLLPRTPPPKALPGGWRRLLYWGLGLWSAGAILWIVSKLMDRGEP